MFKSAHSWDINSAFFSYIFLSAKKRDNEDTDEKLQKLFLLNGAQKPSSSYVT